MNVDKVESLLERSRPAPPPPGLRRRILEAADRKCPPVPASPRKPRWMEVMTVAASILMLLATVSWLLRETPPAPVPGAQESGHPFEERKLTDRLPQGLVEEIVWSADGRHWGCVVPTGMKGEVAVYSAIIDGKREGEYLEVGLPKFGADGRYAYIALDEAGHKLLVNGAPLKDLQTYQWFAWSPDGKKLAYVGTQGEQFFVVEEGRKSGPYTGVIELLWSPDGSSLAYGARLDQDWFVVLNGKKGEPFDGIARLRFSPDGRTLAYSATEGDSLMVVGKAKGPDLTFVSDPVFSADGNTIAYGAAQDTDAFVMVGPVPAGPFARTESFEEVGRPALSADGKTWAFRAKLKGVDKEKVVVSREEKLKQIVIVDGQQKSVDLMSRRNQQATAYDSVSDPILNADGSLVAYAAGKGSRRYLVIGNERSLKFNLIDRISFGPDNRTVAFRAGQYGKQLVVAGENRSDEFDEVVGGPVWSKGGKKVAFTARSGSELWSKVLDVK